jgi:hypothetical protein
MKAHNSIVNNYGDHFPKITLVHSKAGHHSHVREPSVEGGMTSTMLRHRVAGYRWKMQDDGCVEGVVVSSGDVMASTVGLARIMWIFDLNMGCCARWDLRVRCIGQVLNWWLGDVHRFSWWGVVVSLGHKALMAWSLQSSGYRCDVAVSGWLTYVLVKPLFNILIIKGFCIYFYVEVGSQPPSKK